MSQPEEPPELTLQQIFEQHKDMWVAMLVTKRDENMQPVAGKVVAEDVDRYRLRLNIVKYNDICIFFAGETPYPLLM
ncbi:MAG: hypothetical protein JRN15_20360 [Nitrososphaerota archaeon]|nr:hypothetical protein [Nitrososphaerota archaeon]